MVTYQNAKTIAVDASERIPINDPDVQSQTALEGIDECEVPSQGKWRVRCASHS